MNLKVISSLVDVKAFLKELKELLVDPAFNIKTDLDILTKKSSEDASEYLETFIDDKSSLLPPFYAFARKIQSKDVYIKVKIRDRKRCKVFCVSFHYARYPFPQKLPYS